jgi:hypothetical protein
MRARSLGDFDKGRATADLVGPLTIPHCLPSQLLLAAAYELQEGLVCGD